MKMDVVNTNDSISTVSVLGLSDRSSVISFLANESMELTTVMAVSNATNQSSMATTLAGDLEDMLPGALVGMRNFCVSYLSFILWLLSFPANIFIICILLQKKNRNFSTSIYFTSLAAADLVVNFRTLLFWLDRSKLITYRSAFDCKLAKGLPVVGMIGSSWTLAFISTERMLSVCLLQKVKVLCSTTMAKLCILFIWTVSLTIGSVHAWFNELRGSYCGVKLVQLRFFVDNVIYVYFVLDIVAPFVVICVNSIIIVSRLAVIKARSSAHSKAFGTSVTVLVLVVNLVFFITQFPYGVMFVIEQTNAHHASKLRMEFLNYISDIFLVLKYVNNGINFYLYFLTASKFRQEAREVLNSCTRCFSSILNRFEPLKKSPSSISTQLQSI